MRTCALPHPRHARAHTHTHMDHPSLGHSDPTTVPIPIWGWQVSLPELHPHARLLRRGQQLCLPILGTPPRAALAQPVRLWGVGPGAAAGGTIRSNCVAQGAARTYPSADTGMEGQRLPPETPPTSLEGLVLSSPRADVQDLCEDACGHSTAGMLISRQEGGSPVIRVPDNLFSTGI